MSYPVSAVRNRNFVAPAVFAPSDLFVGGYTGDIWDPSLTANLWTDAGITQVASDGDVIGRCTGRVNGNQINQATAANKPTWQTAELNGQPVFRFDGINDVLVASAAIFDFTLQTTILAVTKQDVAIIDQVVVTSTITGAAGTLMRYRLNISAQEIRGLWPLADKATGAVFGTWGVQALVFEATQAANGVTRVYSNGGTAGASASGARTNGNDINLTLGGDGSASFLVGDVAYLLVINRKLTVAELNQFGTWANTRFGTSWVTAT